MQEICVIFNMDKESMSEGVNKVKKDMGESYAADVDKQKEKKNARSWALTLPIVNTQQGERYSGTRWAKAVKM